MRNSIGRFGVGVVLIGAAFAAQGATYHSRFNRAPTISGTPAVSVVVATPYTFTPVANGPGGATLTFSIANMPSWAAFNARTGRLFGTPSSSNVGTYPNIAIRVSDGRLSASLPAFAITVTALANSPPTISGTPATSVQVATAYKFTPSAGDKDGDALGFSISGKPSWAIFNTATGSLTGTPTAAQVGTYLNILISVSDGKASAALLPFAITVTQPAVAGTATLSWTAPTSNTDGSPLTDLVGYHVYHGTSPTALDDIIQLAGATTTSYVFNLLPSGTHYFAVSAYNSAGVESALSNVGYKIIP